MDVDTSLLYRWSGSKFAEVSKSLALGETPYTAYAGDKGKANAIDIANIKNRVDTAETQLTELYDTKADKTDIKNVIEQSYLFGTGAPTTATAAEFVGQMYLDNTNTKFYQCTSITTSETDGTKAYEWIKVIRGNDIPDTISRNIGAVRVDTKYGITANDVVVNNVRYNGVLQIVLASEYDITSRTNRYRAIVPANLDYAVRSVRPVASDTAPTTLAVNTLYSINHSTDTTLNIILPQGQVGDFVQYDFVTGTTAPTVTILSSYGMTAFDFTPEANKIYSLFFDWGIIGNDGTNRYGWRIDYAEYDRKFVFPEEDL